MSVIVPHVSPLQTSSFLATSLTLGYTFPSLLFVDGAELPMSGLYAGGWGGWGGWGGAPFQLPHLAGTEAPSRTPWRAVEP